MGGGEDPLLDYSDILYSPRPMHPPSFLVLSPSFRKSRDEISVKGEGL
jgi:hypothetical protein